MANIISWKALVSTTCQSVPALVPSCVPRLRHMSSEMFYHLPCSTLLTVALLVPVRLCAALF